MICGACETPNEDGRKFCRQCGASLAAPCPSCGTPNAPGVNFCGECGTKLGGGATAPAAPAAAAAREPAAAERAFGEAAALFREIEMPFYGAVVLLERVELLASSGRADECEPLLTEARETFERLRAAPWLERLDAVGVGAATAA